MEFFDPVVPMNDSGMYLDPSLEVELFAYEAASSARETFIGHDGISSVSESAASQIKAYLWAVDTTRRYPVLLRFSAPV